MTPRQKRFLKYTQSGKFISLSKAASDFGVSSKNSVLKWVEGLERQGYKFKKISKYAVLEPKATRLQSYD